MTLRIQSLFLKIFLWFWATVIATGVALVFTWIILQPRDTASQLHMRVADTAWVSGTTAVRTFEQQGAPAASAYIEAVDQRTHMESCLFDRMGAPLAGDCSNFGARATHPPPGLNPVRHGHFRADITLTGNNGRKYIYAVQSTEHFGPPGAPRHPGPPHRIGFSGVMLRWMVAFLVSGLICYLLARYLTTPILRLRQASQHLAAGDLSTRAASGMERRRDEIGSLVRDFNTMATRIEELVSRQRQLIYDISHELRSPLARLNVALDLSRQRKGDDPTFDHMERDLECLNQMIERLLTVARLDASSEPVSMRRLDLTGIVAQIVSSAEFELHDRDGAIRFSSAGQFFVHGNPELLRSAVENVVRNAVRYTSSGGSVDVHLEATGPMVRILVRDYGPGVPESELSKIFQPFYRVDNDRNRESGGTGLGLAIADRVVRHHGGSISARNVDKHGLEVEIRFPLEDDSDLSS